MITTRIFKDDLLQHITLIDFMYKVISINMSEIMGEDFTVDEKSKQMWYENNVIGTSKRSNWKTMIAFDGEKPCAYFQYGEHCENEVLWGEMQIDKMYHGDGETFRALINSYLNDQDFINYEFIQGHINVKNNKSRSVFTSIGLAECEKTARGTKYIGLRKNIEKWSSVKNTIAHYDCLIDENNDPVRDVQALRDYMDKWDGQAFFDLLQLDKTKTVLEIGVGSGRLAIKTLPLVKHFVGIDISPKTIKRASENLAEFKNKTLICADFLKYKFTEKFDVIYSSLTFLHIKEKQQAIQKIAELLKNGGRFVLSLDKEHKGNKFDYGNRTLTIYPDTPQEIKQYITNAGLTVVSEKEIEFANIIVAKR